MSEEDLALIKLGKLGTITTLCADTAGNVGVWRKFRKFLPAPQEGQTLPPTYNLQTMEEGCEVISTDNSRTQVTELKGKLMGFYGAIYSELPQRLAVIAKDGKLYLSGLMGKGFFCLLTPTGGASEENATEEEVKAFLQEKTVRSTKRNVQDPVERRRKDCVRKVECKRLKLEGGPVLASKKHKPSGSTVRQPVCSPTHTHAPLNTPSC